MAIGVDTSVYLKKIASGHRKCDQLVGAVEALSRQLQREDHGAEYHFPILAGVGEGGALPEAILAQASVNTLAGAVSLDPSALLQTTRPLCSGAPSAHDDGRYSYWPIPVLDGFWSVGLTPSESTKARAHFETLVALAAHPNIQSLNASGQSEMLTSLIAPHLDQDIPAGVAALPLFELPASRPSRLMAVLLPRGGGWRDLDKTIAEDIQSQGVSVVGWDSVRYFWRKKSPEQTVSDLAAVIDAYAAKRH